MKTWLAALLPLSVVVLAGCDEGSTTSTDSGLRKTESMIVAGTDGRSYNVSITYDTAVLDAGAAAQLIQHVAVVGGQAAPTPVETGYHAPGEVRPYDPHWEVATDHPFEVRVTPETIDGLTADTVDDSSWRWMDQSDIPSWSSFCPPGHAG